MLVAIGLASATAYVFQLVQLFRGSTGSRNDFVVVTVLGVVGIAYVAYTAVLNRSLVLGIFAMSEIFLAGGVGYTAVRDARGVHRALALLLGMVIVAVVLYSWAKLDVVVHYLRKWTGVP